MCLTNASEIKTAEKNILVYKELWFGVTSPYQSYKYTKGLQEKDVKIRVSEIKKVWEGYQTFTFFITKPTDCKICSILLYISM